MSLDLLVFVDVKEDSTALDLEVSHDVGEHLPKELLNIEELVASQVAVLLVFIHVLQEVGEEVGETEGGAGLRAEQLVNAIRYVTWNIHLYRKYANVSRHPC